jgi:hypothetical protein
MSSYPPTDPADKSALWSLSCREANPPTRMDRPLEPLRPLIEIDTDRLTIALVRFICSAYVTGRGSYWHAALTSAEQVLGPADGPSFFARAAAVVCALRKERCWVFRFLPPECELASSDERALLNLLRATRQPDPGVVKARAAALTGQDRPASIIAAVMTLAGLQMRHHQLVHADMADSATPPPAVARPRLH